MLERMLFMMLLGTMVAGARGGEAGDKANAMKDMVLASRGQSSDLDDFSHVVLAFTALAHSRSIADVHYAYRGFGTDDATPFAKSLLLSTAFAHEPRARSFESSARAVWESFGESKLRSAHSLGPVGHAYMVAAAFLNPHELSMDRLHGGLLEQSVREGHFNRPTRFDSDTSHDGYLLNVFLTTGSALSRAVTIRRVHDLQDDAVFFGDSLGIDAPGSALIAAICAANSRPVDAFAQLFTEVTRSLSLRPHEAMMLAAAGLSQGYEASVQQTFRQLSSSSVRAIMQSIDDAYQETRGSLGNSETAAAAAAAALLLSLNPPMSDQVAGIGLLILAIREPIE